MSEPMHILPYSEVTNADEKLAKCRHANMIFTESSTYLVLTAHAHSALYMSSQPVQRSTTKSE